MKPSADRTPPHSTNVRVRIVEDWSRQPIPVREVVIEHMGGETTPYFDEKPPYVVGEEHVLFLHKQASTDDPLMYITTGPMGRYRVKGGVLESATRDYQLNRELDGRTVQDVKERVDDSQR